MEDLQRHQVRDLLQRWQRGEIDERQVHEEAEVLWDCYVPGEEYDRESPQSIALDVLSSLETLNVQLVTPEDIPAMLRFLETPADQERRGWQIWHQYWRSIDYNQRRQSLRDNPYYSIRQRCSEHEREE